MESKRCFFIGHRDAPITILSELEAVIEKHIVEYGVKEFIVGRYGNFDYMVNEVLIRLKLRHPSIVLLLLLPYHPAERPIVMPEGFDATYYPPGMERVPRRYAIVHANKYVLDHSDYLIAYAWHPASNAIELLEHARVREKAGLITVSMLSSSI